MQQPVNNPAISIDIESQIKSDSDKMIASMNPILTPDQHDADVETLYQYHIKAISK